MDISRYLNRFVHLPLPVFTNGSTFDLPAHILPPGLYAVCLHYILEDSLVEEEARPMQARLCVIQSYVFNLLSANVFFYSRFISHFLFLLLLLSNQLHLSTHDITPTPLYQAFALLHNAILK